MTRSLITGGAGFIGSHISDSLLALGHEVFVVDDLSSGRKENLSPKVSFAQLDIRSTEFSKALNDIKPDIVVHAAAQISVRASLENPVFDVEVNVKGLVNLLHAFAGKPLPYIVFISTGGAMYGEQDYFPADEDHAIRPESVYGMSKRAGELYLDLWRRMYGLRTASLRLANVYGPRQNPHGEAGVVAIFSERILRGETPLINGSGEQTRDFVFVKDVADAVLKVIESKTSGTFNIGTGVETPVNNLYKLIAAAAGSTLVPQHGPAKLGEQKRSCISSNLAGKSFGWKAITELEEGIKETVAWFKGCM